MASHALRRAAVAGLCLLAAAGCATLPDTDALIERHSAQAARFESARGPLTEKQNAVVLAELKRKSGDIDILERQIALEQAINDSPLTIGNKVTLLQDGAATYAAMFAAIRAAKSSVNLETYIIEDDEIGQQFSSLLLEKQGAGVQVNVIYDGVGALLTPPAFFKRLTDGGIQVLEFNPVNAAKAMLPWTLNNRDHRKLLVVDGRTAFIGGINISSVYSSGSVVKRSVSDTVTGTGPGAADGTPFAWRDTDLKLEGPVVGEFQKLFLETWEKQKGPPLGATEFLPALRPQGKDIVRAIGSTPDDPFSLIYLTLISAIGNAEKQVYLTNAYFVPDRQLLKALVAAAGRGVDVKLILPSHTDSQNTFHAGRSHYSGLLEGGVRIYERQGELLHSKTAVIDGVWSTVGSSNLDWRSALDNNEVNAVVLGREFADQMLAMFAKDLEASKAIDLETWERRSPMLRIRELVGSLMQRLL